MPKTPSLEDLARLQAERDAIPSKIRELERRKKEIDRFLEKHSKQETSELTEGSQIEELKLSPRPFQILKTQLIFTIGPLIRLTETELVNMPNSSRKVVNEIKKALAKHGFRLKPSKPLK